MIQDLALILIVAGIVTLLFRKLRQPLVLGYIMAGFIVSPNMPYFSTVGSIENVHEWSEIGVMFFMFSLGLEFSFRKLLKMGLSPIITTLTIISAMTGLGMLVGRMLLGLEGSANVLLGAMLSMSSTAVIYKAYDELGISQQKFTSRVLGVLILEDVMGIIMLVLLPVICAGGSPERAGGKILGSIGTVGFFLVVAIVIGMVAIPVFFRKVRRFLSDETLLVVSLGLCCLLAVISHGAGLSEAFGAFVMGSILAETIEVDRIERIVTPVKDLFCAIFFVSVGMLIKPQPLVEHIDMVAILVLVVLCGQAILGTLCYRFGGLKLGEAMKCSFSMVQIGEFSFIIAQNAVSKGAIPEYIFPVIVAVSVITTFLTPYMIRAAQPAHSLLMKMTAPGRGTKTSRVQGEGAAPLPQDKKARTIRPRTAATFVALLRQLLANTLVYGILAAAVTLMWRSYLLHALRGLLPHWWANGLCLVVALLLLAPLLRSIVMKKQRSLEVRHLLAQSRAWYIVVYGLFLVRFGLTTLFVFYVLRYLVPVPDLWLGAISVAIMLLILWSRHVKHVSIRLERRFLRNLRQREIHQRQLTRYRPLYADRLLDRDFHIAEFTIPADSLWTGRTLRDLSLARRFHVQVGSIFRGSRRINIPDGETILFPGDRIRVVGTDEHLSQFHQALGSELHDLPEEHTLVDQEMHLRQHRITPSSPIFGKTLRESGLRDIYNCMAVGLEKGEANLSRIPTDHVFANGDILWLIGEEKDLRRLMG